MIRTLMVAFSLLVACVVGMAATAAVEASPATVRITPDPLTVTTFFSGASVKVEGEAPKNMELAVLLNGTATDVELKKKGKVWGLLWMNVGEAEIKNVPSVYLLATADRVCELAPFAVRQAEGIGLDALAAGREMASSGEEEEVFAEFVKLKEHENLYASFEGSLTTKAQAASSNQVGYTAVLPVPARIPEGSYGVELWGFHDAQAQLLATSVLTVETVGVTHDIASFARNHGLLYGVCALLLALVVGLATGLIFGLAGKGGH